MLSRQAARTHFKHKSIPLEFYTQYTHKTPILSQLDSTIPRGTGSHLLPGHDISQALFVQASKLVTGSGSKTGVRRSCCWLSLSMGTFWGITKFEPFLPRSAYLRTDQIGLEVARSAETIFMFALPSLLFHLPSSKGL